eukprot:3559417-Amphidinium_carterae.1
MSQGSGSGLASFLSLSFVVEMLWSEPDTRLHLSKHPADLKPPLRIALQQHSLKVARYWSSGILKTTELLVKNSKRVAGANPFTDAEYDLFVSEYVAEAPALQGLGHPAMEDGLIDYQEIKPTWANARHMGHSCVVDFKLGASEL